jgi:hypothetical protein
MPHIIGKVLMRATTLLCTSLQSEVWTQSYGPPKLKESQFWEFQDSNLRALGQNDIWVLALWPNVGNIIRGKVVAFPPSLGHGEFCEFVFAHASTMHQKCFNYALTNLLFSLCKSMWIIDLLIILPSPHPGALARPFTPKVLWAKNHASIPYPFDVHPFNSQLSP